MYIYEITEYLKDDKTIKHIKSLDQLADINILAKEMETKVLEGEILKYNMKELSKYDIRKYNTYNLVNSMEFDDFIKLMDEMIKLRR